MTVYIGNALSLSMFDASLNNWNIHCDVLSVDQVREWLAECNSLPISCIGHADTAEIVSDILGFEVPVNRVSVSLATGDMILVAQYSGPRLPEGAKQLPPGSSIRFIRAFASFRSADLA
jgi:hypothetical protein